MKSVRSRAAVVRKAVGVLLLLTAAAIGLNLTAGLQRDLPGYTDALQSHFEQNSSAKKALDSVTGENSGGKLANCTSGASTLAECGTAPNFTGIDQWLNTPGGKPLTIAGLKGKVVLVDFWTYSCINCQRTLPHLEAWYKAYAADGLTIVGVHTPEFDFEHVVSNVKSQAAALGVHYPIAIDNNYATWTAYNNEYWPAEYLIDSSGDVRHVDFGEGGYSQSESFIRELLQKANPSVVLPKPTEVINATPTQVTTPESYLGYNYPLHVSGETVQNGVPTNYTLPAVVQQDEFAYGGNWTVGSEESTAGADAELSLQFEASDVYLVLGGSGTVSVSVNGVATKKIVVGGTPTLYQLVSSPSSETALLNLRMTPGVQAYDFTFG